MGDTVTAMVRGTMAILMTTHTETAGTGIVAVTVRTVGPGNGGRNKKRGKVSNFLFPPAVEAFLPLSSQPDWLIGTVFLHDDNEISSRRRMR